MLNKKNNILFSFLTVVTIATTCAQGAEQITVTSYYPSPFGSYDRLRLVPRATLPAADCNAANEGVMYYDQGANNIVACRETSPGTFQWTSGAAAGPWTQNINDIYPTDTATNPNLRVGIGTTTPGAKLHVIGGPGWTVNNWSKAIGLATGNAIEFGLGGEAGKPKYGIGQSDWASGGFYHFITTSEGGGPMTYYQTVDPSGNVDINTRLGITANSSVWGGWLEAIRFSSPSHSAITLPSGGLLFGLHGNRNFYFADTIGGKYAMTLNAQTGDLDVAGNINTQNRFFSGGEELLVFRNDCNDGCKNCTNGQDDQTWCGPSHPSLRPGNCAPFIVQLRQNDNDEDDIKAAACGIANNRLFFFLWTEGDDDEETSAGAVCGAVCGLRVINNP